MPTKNPCACCKKPVKCNQKALLCTVCNKWVHIVCAGVSQSQYNDRREHFVNWRSSICIFEELQFFGDELDLHVDIYRTMCR